MDKKDKIYLTIMIVSAISFFIGLIQFNYFIIYSSALILFVFGMIMKAKHVQKLNAALAKKK